MGNRWGRVESSREILNNRLHPRVQPVAAAAIAFETLLVSAPFFPRVKEEKRPRRGITHLQNEIARLNPRARTLGDFFISLIAAEHCASTGCGAANEQRGRLSFSQARIRPCRKIPADITRTGTASFSVRTREVPSFRDENKYWSARAACVRG